jgi:hypothetical protein
MNRQTVAVSMPSQAQNIGDNVVNLRPAQLQVGHWRCGVSKNAFRDVAVMEDICAIEAKLGTASFPARGCCGPITWQELHQSRASACPWRGSPAATCAEGGESNTAGPMIQNARTRSFITHVLDCDPTR